MKRGIAIALVGLVGILGLFAESADQIVAHSRNRIQKNTLSSRAKMIITAKDGSTTERLVDQYSSYAGGRTRTVVIFQKPASVAGTRFLTIENPGKDDDRWIFLPSLGKIRRISGGEGSNSFVGTDFSYDDISSADRKVDKDDHTLLTQKEYQGKDCYVIQSVPKDKTYQYSKMVSWIDTKPFVAYKLELYDHQNQLVKVMEVQDLKDMQGRLTPMLSKMTSVQNGTSTTLSVEIIKYDDPIPEGVFTTRFLETGRP